MNYTMVIYVLIAIVYCYGFYRAWTRSSKCKKCGTMFRSIDSDSWHYCCEICEDDAKYAKNEKGATNSMSKLEALDLLVVHNNFINQHIIDGTTCDCNACVCCAYQTLKKKCNINHSISPTLAKNRMIDYTNQEKI